MAAVLSASRDVAIIATLGLGDLMELDPCESLHVHSGSATLERMRPDTLVALGVQAGACSARRQPAEWSLREVCFEAVVGIEVVLVPLVPCHEVLASVGSVAPVLAFGGQSPRLLGLKSGMLCASFRRRALADAQRDAGLGEDAAT